MSANTKTPPPSTPSLSGIAARAGEGAMTQVMPPKIAVDRLRFYYGQTQALDDISISIPTDRVTAFIGPSGCGKSTFLRTLNRMNDIIPGTRVEGRVAIDDQDIYSAETDVVELRRHVGMVFQKSNPFPKSIFDNVAYGLRVNGLAESRSELEGRVEVSLKSAAFWDEVKDRLRESALALSGGQQQRLCIARALAIRPEILLMDEPASALDPIATQRIEDPSTTEPALDLILISRHLERIGDHATNIGEEVIFSVSGRDVRHHAQESGFDEER